MLFSQKRFIIIANDAQDFVREKLFMKRCPQCNTVYENAVDYCPNDGKQLIEEVFSLPSSDFEDATIIRREPIVVDLSTPPAAAYEPVNQPIPASTPENIIVEVPAKNTSRNSAIYLALGLLLGGILVLTTLILARNFYSNGGDDNSKQIAVNVSAQNAKPKTTPLENKNAVENKNTLDLSANAKHDERTATDDEEFNGRVIARNAYVRASPAKSAAQTDVLPLGDRINIERRENESSPWFYVSCEHGTSGWMHGDTIEYTR